jgi:copper transport protein
MVCAFAVLSAPAFAHAVLEGSDPAAGAEITRAPAQITLTFDEPVETSLGSLRVLDATGRQRSSGAVVHPDGDPARIAIRLGPLPRGRYVVVWRVVSVDSHIVGGGYAFGIGVPAGGAPSLAADPAAAILTPIVHFVLLASALLAIGVPIGALALIGARGGATVIEFAAWFVLLFAAFADVAVRAQLGGGTLADSFATHTSALRGLTMLAAVCGIASLFGRQRNWFGLVPAGALLVLSLGAAGHAADGAWPALGIAADALHLIAAAAWIGVIGVAARLGPSAVLRAISPVAMLATGTIVLTGIVQTVRNAGAWQPLLTTGYGRAIDLKIALMLGAFLLAWSMRGSMARGSFALRRRLSIECGVLAAVVAVTAVLVDLPLPRDEAIAAPAPSLAFRAGAIDVHVTATPLDPLHWTLHVDGHDDTGAAHALDAVDATITERLRHAGPLTVPLARSPSGAYDGTINLPFAGAWSAFVSARSGDFDEGHITLALPETPP